MKGTDKRLRYVEGTNLCYGVGRPRCSQDRQKYIRIPSLPTSLSANIGRLEALLGATNPLASAPGTIRGDYALVSDVRGEGGLLAATDNGQDVGRNVCHGSDSVENAKKEIALWFKEGELVSWKSAQHDWIYEKP